MTRTAPLIGVLYERSPDGCRAQLAMQSLLILFSLTVGLTAGLAQAGAEGVLRVNPETLRIIDAEGRERFFHGVNVVVKQFPWIPEGDAYPFNETDMQRLQKLGLNSLRLVQNSARAAGTGGYSDHT